MLKVYFDSLLQDQNLLSFVSAKSIQIDQMKQKQVTISKKNRVFLTPFSFTSQSEEKQILMQKCLVTLQTFVWGRFLALVKKLEFFNFVFQTERESSFFFYGLRARARPSLGEEFTAFESYSADKVMSDFGLHSLCTTIPAFPLSETLVFTVVNGSRE